MSENISKDDFDEYMDIIDLLLDKYIPQKSSLLSSFSNVKTDA